MVVKIRGGILGRGGSTAGMSQRKPKSTKRRRSPKQGRVTTRGRGCAKAEGNRCLWGSNNILNHGYDHVRVGPYLLVYVSFFSACSPDSVLVTIIHEDKTFGDGPRIIIA
jgi:hypothetical protein